MSAQFRGGNSFFDRAIMMFMLGRFISFDLRFMPFPACFMLVLLLASLILQEYMSNRKTYDKAHDETPQTTYMRDVLNTMLDFLLTQKFGIPVRRHTKKTPATCGAPVLKREVNDDGTASWDLLQSTLSRQLL